MSKETTSTTFKERSEVTSDHPDMSADELRAKFEEPSYTGPRPKDAYAGPVNQSVENINEYIDNETGWVNEHTYVNGKYSLTSEDLVESRMTIGPDVSANHSTSETPKSKKETDARAETAITEEQFTQPTLNSESISEDHEQVRRKGLFRRMGRSAINGIVTGAKWFDQKGALASLYLINKLGGKTIEERKQYQEELNEKYAASDDDSRWQRIKKSFGRNKLNIRDRVMPYGIVAAVGALAADRVYSGVMNYQASSKIETGLSNVQGHEVELTAKTTVLTIGGATDINGDLATAGGERMGLYKNGATNIKANYSASIGPFVGTDRMEDSTNQVIPQAFDAYHQANGGPMVLYGFSEGSVGAWKSAEALKNAGLDVSNVDLIVDGGPLGAMGLGNSQYVGAVNPFLKAAGIDITRDIPNLDGFKSVTVRSYSGDLWGAGGNDAGVTQAAMVAGLNAHQQVDPNTSYLIKSVEIDGVVYEEWGFKEGPQHPLGRLLYSQGLYVSPAMDRVLNSFAPVTHIGEDTKYANANEVTDSIAALIDDTIKFHTGYDSDQAQRIIEKVMQDNPEYSRELQNVLQLTRTIDRVALMANDPSTIQTELPKVMEEIKAAMTTTESYLKPNAWVDVINNSAESLGLGNVIKLKHFEQSEAGQWTDRSTQINAQRQHAAEVSETVRQNLQKTAENLHQGVQDWLAQERQKAEARQAVRDAQPPVAPPAPEPTPTPAPNNSHSRPWTPPSRPTQPYVPTAEAAPTVSAPAPTPPPAAPAPEVGVVPPAADHSAKWREALKNIFRPREAHTPADTPRGTAPVADNVGVPTHPINTGDVAPDFGANDLVGANR